MVLYIDYIFIYSETLEDHVKYIYQVSSKCTSINLKGLLDKCNLVQHELLALGYKVSGLILAINQKKVAAVLQNPVPKNIKQLQSFLWLASYYKHYIKYFSHITRSVYELCSEDIFFDITKERRDSYERIKYQLTNASILMLPEFELPLKLEIHAAFSQGLGAALNQRKIVDGEPREWVICYFSRKLQDSEARYGDTQAE
ncbi:hypothetical protein O181_045161 [Austropuccinia psidii MF-1]|uniref:Reverse transcriptase/retrotransposon-derived protein RNase H-like domain-containing protein n=1 Tax=Austropuccinia psidii MF-1 TaxID=1389203 RepID=A0A9Q3DRT2_9BASI|nr:hypothetical protein [Austropuccinia psidii MF-1]